MCISSLRCPACNAHAPYCHLWPASLYKIFPLYFIKGMIFGEKKSEHKNVFQFSLLICLKYFSNSKKNWYDMKYLLTAIGLTAGGRSTVHIYTQTIHRIEQDMIKMYIGLHVKYPLFLSHFNPLNPELNPICYLLALLGAHRFLHVSRIRVKLLTFRLLMSYIYIWSTHS